MANDNATAQRVHMTSNARRNITFWRRLVGTKPLHGHWRHRRINARVLTFIWLVSLTLATVLVLSAEKWSFHGEPMARCWVPGMLKEHTHLFDIGDEPAGSKCEIVQTFNGRFHVPLACLIGGLVFLGLRVNRRPGPTDIYDEGVEANRVLVRSCVIVTYPQMIEVDRNLFDGLTQAEIETRLRDQIVDRLDIDAAPFAQDVANLAGFTVLSKNWRTALRFGRISLGRWLANETQSHVIAEVENPPEQDLPEEG